MNENEKLEGVMNWLDNKAKTLEAAMMEARHDDDSPEINRISDEMTICNRWYDELMDRACRDWAMEQNRAKDRLERWEALVLS